MPHLTVLVVRKTHTTKPFLHAHIPRCSRRSHRKQNKLAKLRLRTRLRTSSPDFVATITIKYGLSVSRDTLPTYFQGDVAPATAHTPRNGMFSPETRRNSQSRSPYRVLRTLHRFCVPLFPLSTNTSPPLPPVACEAQSKESPFRTKSPRRPLSCRCLRGLLAPAARPLPC